MLHSEALLPGQNKGYCTEGTKMAKIKCEHISHSIMSYLENKRPNLASNQSLNDYNLNH